MQQAVPKLWIFFFLIIVILVVAIFVSGPPAPSSGSNESSVPEPTRYATFEEMLDLGGNAIYVENQKSGSTSVLVGFVVLSAPGYVVIYNDNSGVPGSVIGESVLFQTGGEHLTISLNEPLVENQVYYAMLYHDDGDGRFRADTDVQVVDSEQSVVLMTFLASLEAEPEPGPIEP
ncbi:hypothetical protein EPN81_05055 [Patescibacteria group bacterium]|nr:MAG: hypothetical protein EPN81_05055 [Patescibacteria group bacterium]